MKTKFFVVLVAGSFFLHHLGCTILYLLPNNPLTIRYAPWVDAYMSPAFVQNWNLFAPEPATSGLNVVYRCGHEKNWSDWKDTLSSLTSNHARTRFTPRGKILYIYQGIARELLNSYVMEKNKRNCVDGPCLKVVEDQIRNQPAFQLATRWIQDVCGWEGKSFDRFQFQIMKIFPRQFSERHQQNATQRVERIQFSPVEVRS